jgi:hypothetical protein
VPAGFDIAFLDRHQELSPTKSNGPTWWRAAICARTIVQQKLHIRVGNELLHGRKE